MNRIAELSLVVLCPTLVFLAGCGDATMDMRQKVADELIDLSVESDMDVEQAKERCRSACRLMGLLDVQGREKVLSTWIDRLRCVRFGDDSSDMRLASLDRCVALLEEAFGMLDPIVSNREALWMFKLSLLRRINDELNLTETEPRGGTHECVKGGNLTTLRNYRERLMNCRFRMIQSSFETGPFSVYYNSLSDSAKSNWIAQIEAIACRKVVIYDPRNPFEQLPRYMPVDDRKWCIPSNKPGKPREYIEHLGGGKLLRMREVR